MRTNTERKPALARIGKAASIVLTLTVLAALIGCQGLSQSGGGQQNQQIGNLVLGSASLNFGSVAPNTSKSLALTVTNSGNKAVNISSASTSTKYFALTPMTFPVSVPAGQSTNLSISFTPNAAATFSATLSISSDASNGAQSVALSGTGTGVTSGALSANPTNLSFGSVTIGNQSSIQETITNTGASSVTVSKVGITGAGLSVSGIATPLTLNGGRNATFTVSFIPTASGAVSGNLIVTSTATNSTLTIPVSATGVTPGALAANPTSLSFGNVNVGSKGTISEIITNTGSSSVSVSKVAITGAGFSVSGLTTPLTLNAGQNSPQFSVSFAPTTAGAVNGNLTITSTATNPTLTIPVSGTGITGQLSVSPATLAVGNVTVGSSGTATGTLTASGASVTVTAAATNNSAFTISGFSLPHTIAAGQSTNFNISFHPTASGSATATLTFTSSAQPSTTTEALTGTGVAASTHSVALSWSASTSSNISGYNVYRAPYTTSTSSCGSFVRINSVLDASTLYTDSSIANGSVYCYATTAVDTSNVESGYSNIVSNVQIPTT